MHTCNKVFKLFVISDQVRPNSVKTFGLRNNGRSMIIFFLSFWIHCCILFLQTEIELLKAHNFRLLNFPPLSKVRDYQEIFWCSIGHRLHHCPVRSFFTSYDNDIPKCTA